MFYLVFVSLLWSFSFGINKVWLGDIDAFLVATVRLFLALLVFLPWFRPTGLKGLGDYGRLLLIGAVQYGVMYMAYTYCFSILKAYEAALFSIFTPFYVILFNQIIERRWEFRLFICALLSVAGAGIIEYSRVDRQFWFYGFGLMQVANASFALGQVCYKHWRQKHLQLKDREVFALVYLGGFLISGLTALQLTDWASVVVSAKQYAALTYLGVVASGLGLFLWNVGATQTEPGPLAVLNNLLVPLAVLVSLFVFTEGQSLNVSQWIRLILGGGVILIALGMAKR